MIADERYCDWPTASVIINNMERRGWVECQSDPSSKRRRRVALTRQGRRKMQELERVGWHDGFDPLDALDDREKKQLEDLLKK